MSDDDYRETTHPDTAKHIRVCRMPVLLVIIVNYNTCVMCKRRVEMALYTGGCDDDGGGGSRGKSKGTSQGMENRVVDE